MTARFDLRAASPEGFAAMTRLGAFVHGCGLDHALLELVKIRVSQINGCAFCIDMHVTAARRLGQDEQRLHLLAAWREAPVFSAAERAALEWAETLTRLPDGEVPDTAYAQAEAQFSTQQLANLTLAVAEINAWNRLMMAARTPPLSVTSAARSA
ncbi:MAG: carboxymuconolactone decarboxylase family protein [Piscinibacter sp.]|uniref:carboxymuconolactone decarboxylase family protein n=1 Tax=Piscinibacter sp. TaxID=1903157 RepID=UPI0011DBDD43|nr:carboxymuconolactone decarboxylase family protein [Piscinibacter sp.]MBP5991121.1 carboxymuconolactone decarboxylase family protein [Piscinibacter sp.]MBP6028333.1 carboxymuconolactone decarboxylase family protein [Piscinibacter sp.]TXH61652.1 MAG: carboxymuconolactone decarboxylase family protein [Burkholderiaceae bacterium]